MVDKESNTRDDIGEVLGVGRRVLSHHYVRWAIIGLVVLLIAFSVYRLFAPSKAPALNYETVEARQGNLTVTVAATGTLQPVNKVDVGSELSGTIQAVLVDFNDRVKRGQVLARLDTDRLKAQVIEARESLESAKAKLEEAKATVLETHLRFERCEKLAARQLCTAEQVDTARAAHSRAKAAESSAKAQVAVARATLGLNETNLAKAEIRSPIDGIVLQRQIELGQTVAASLQAPVLFTLAEDLARMELHVAVDEADVGKVGEGQTAVFTVDAYPERSFPARITQVRFSPQTVEGVVTYESVLLVDNADLSLRPGMTATAVITVQRLEDVLLLPNAALRFTPPVTQTAQRSSGGGVFSSLFRRPPSERRRPDNSGIKRQQVWVLRDGVPAVVSIKAGASDGKFTEIRSGEIQLGQAVIVEASSVKK